MTASHDPHPCVVAGFDGSAASHVALSRAIERVGRTASCTSSTRGTSPSPGAAAAPISRSSTVRSRMPSP